MVDVYTFLEDDVLILWFTYTYQEMLNASNAVKDGDSIKIIPIKDFICIMFSILPEDIQHIKIRLLEKLEIKTAIGRVQFGRFKEVKSNKQEISDLLNLTKEKINNLASADLDFI